MSEDAEKYLYFKVGLLKNSFALEALWQDALRYHMTDQPAKLIAMRLTEYYELTHKGQVPPATSISTPTNPSIPMTPNGREDKEEIETPTLSSPASHALAAHLSATSPVVRPVTPTPNAKATSTTANQAGNFHPEGEISVTVSAEVDQNAEEAADYWSLL
jgi:hypothetical protein